MTSNIERHVVEITWNTKVLPTVEAMPTLLRMLADLSPAFGTMQPDPARALQINGHDATQLYARNETVQMSLTNIACGKRSVRVYVVTSRDLDAMHERIQSSFDCHPIAAQEAAIDPTAAPFGIDDPALLAGWHRTSIEDSCIQSLRRADLACAAGVTTGAVLAAELAAAAMRAGPTAPPP